MFNIDIIQEEADWQQLAGEWNELLEKSITNVPFLCHEFLYAWWQHRGGGEWQSDSLCILTARSQDGQLVGVLPLFISKNHAGKPALILLGSVEIADFLDVLCPPDKLQEFLTAALAHLKENAPAEWEAVELYNLLETTPTLDALQAAAGELGLNYQQEKLQPAPHIELPDDFDNYLGSLDGRYRREMVRKMRNALNYFIPVEVKKVEEGDDLQAEMEDFFTMMREEPDKDEFLTPEMEEQMQAIASAALDSGWLDLSFLIVGRDKAAGYLTFHYNNHVWVYNSAHAQKFANLSPGIVLMGLLIQEAIEEDKDVFDFMRGDEEYKYHLGGQDRWVLKATITR